MAWVADLSYDDNDMAAPPVLVPGQPFRKGWQVRNTGNCTWDGSHFPSFVYGNLPGAGMGGAPVAVSGRCRPALRPTSTPISSPRSFPAPTRVSGRCTTAAGNAFGERPGRKSR